MIESHPSGLSKTVEVLDNRKKWSSNMFVPARQRKEEHLIIPLKPETLLQNERSLPKLKKAAEDNNNTKAKGMKQNNNNDDDLLKSWKAKKDEIAKEILLREKRIKDAEREEKEGKRKEGEKAWLKWNEEKDKLRKAKVKERQKRDKEIIKNSQFVIEERNKSLLPLMKKLDERWNKKLHEKSLIRKQESEYVKKKLDQVKLSPYVGSHPFSLIESEIFKKKKKLRESNQKNKNQEVKQEDDKYSFDKSDHEDNNGTKDIYSNDSYSEYSEYSHEKKDKKSNHRENESNDDAYSNDDGFEDISDNEEVGKKVIIETGTLDWGNISALPIEPIPYCSSQDNFEDDFSPPIQQNNYERIQTSFASNRIKEERKNEGGVERDDIYKSNQSKESSAEEDEKEGDEDVQQALIKINEIHPSVWKQIVKEKSPSKETCRIFGALCVIIEREATWKNALHFIQSKDFFDVLIEKSNNMIKKKNLELVGKFLLESLPHETLASLGEGELAIYRWIRAIQAFALEKENKLIEDSRLHGKSQIGPQMFDPHLTCIFGDENEDDSDDTSEES